MAIEGICVAFGDSALTVSPTWERLDSTDHLVSSYTVDRGRAVELDKTGTGSAEIKIIDQEGLLDPTNSSSDYWDADNSVTTVDPTRQVGIALYNPVADTWSTIFRGFAEEYNFELDIAKQFLSLDLPCVDLMDILAGAEMKTGVSGTLPVPSGSDGNIVYAAATVDDRIKALLIDAGLDATWQASLTSIFTGNVNVKQTVYSPGTSILSAILDAADAEFPGVANVYVAKDGTFTFHGRLARFNPTDSQYGITTWACGDEVACAADDTLIPIAALGFTRSKNHIINSAYSAPREIADADIADQYVDDATSQAAYGTRSESFDNLICDGHVSPGTTTDLVETKKFGSYYVDNYATPRTRINRLVFKAKAAGHPLASQLWQFLCEVDISDLVTVTTSHPGGGGFDENFYVEGLHYQVAPTGDDKVRNVTLTLDVSPQAYYTTNPFSS